MKQTLIAMLLLIAAGCLLVSGRRAAKNNPVNAVIGDRSYTMKYGQAPNEQTDERTRVQTHLLYAEALVRRNTQHVTNAATREKRNALMQLLHQYAMAAAYPANADFPGERKPCFIDREGNICAVGYLVEKTAGRAAAEQINARHQYATIEEMKRDATLQVWVAQSGLTLEECAIIQPTYGYPVSPDGPANQEISKGYGISTGLSAGCNIAFNAINKYQISHGGKSKLVPVLGLATGAFSIINGIRHFPDEPAQGAWGPEPVNNTKKLMSVGNISLGAVTMAMSTWNLIKNRKQKPEQKTSWNMFSQPAINGKMAYGLSLSRKIG